MGTRLYVLGHPVGHSKSPVMHNAAYAALSLPWRYGFADIPDSADARAFIEAGDWLALNVTMPYKPLALASAEVASDAARLAGGANVLVRAATGKLHADNVDGKGLVSFLRRSGADVAGKRIAVCGTGPTSLSIMHACAQAGAQDVTLLGRDADKSREVVDEYIDLSGTLCGQAGLSRCAIESASYEEGLKSLASAQVIVDATPLGMSQGDPAPFDTSLLHAGRVVVDVVYGHGESRLLAAARAAGCRAYDGAGMLVGQAVETVRVVAGLVDSPPVPDDVDLYDVMARAAGFDLARPA